MAKRIIVDVRRQLLFAYDGMILKHRFDCVTGDQQNPTTVGRHRVLRKHRVYTSRTYGVPMNFAMFFHGGEAIHESRVVGPMSYARSILRAVGAEEYDPFGSHGCVRLSSSDARTLFDWTPMRTAVNIARDYDETTGSARF